jgi:hypothetical protein
MVTFIYTYSILAVDLVSRGCISVKSKDKNDKYSEQDRNLRRTQGKHYY